MNQDSDARWWRCSHLVPYEAVLRAVPPSVSGSLRVEGSDMGPDGSRPVRTSARNISLKDLK
jgi:hypothetical protein